MQRLRWRNQNDRSSIWKQLSFPSSGYDNAWRALLYQIPLAARRRLGPIAPMSIGWPCIETS